jgi:NADPH-dependent 2,4-dienoyl-CoA reductase/sulfur reductase-like enzyme/rhodanese-related sulfurtransferase
MAGKRIIIIGGGAGGASAAARARSLSEEVEIIVVERGPYVSFANCGLPDVVGGEIAAENTLLIQTPDNLRDRFNLDVRVLTEAVCIDRQAQHIELHELTSDTCSREAYDALVLATGAAPFKPPISGIAHPAHFTVRTMLDAESMIAWIEDRPVRRAVVVGGGSIGLEMVEQLQRRGLSVALAEALPQVMAPLDPEMAAWLHEELRAHGVTLHLGDGVAAFEVPQAGEAAAVSVVVLKSGTRLPADIVILGLGVRPEVDLARKAGLAIGEQGGIRVNEHLQTSDPHIWAVGDAVEVRDAVTGAWSLIPLAGPASRQGRIAADKILGRPSRDKGTWATAILRLFDLTAACTGASEKTLRHAGIPFEVIYLHSDLHAGSSPGASPIALKLLFAPDTGKLLGAQAVGGEDVDKRIDVLATALQAGMSVHDLAALELAYAPPLGAAKDPVNLAGMIAQNILAGDINVIQCHEIADLAPHKRVILDVRDNAKRQQGYIPGSVHIPLPQLRSRLSELPRDGEIIPYWRSGQRAYDACRILSQHGFRVRHLTASYRTWPTATIHRNMGHCSELAEPPPGLARRMRPGVSCRGTDRSRMAKTSGCRLP